MGVWRVWLLLYVLKNYFYVGVQLLQTGMMAPLAFFGLFLRETYCIIYAYVFVCKISFLLSWYASWFLKYVRSSFGFSGMMLNLPFNGRYRRLVILPGSLDKASAFLPLFAFRLEGVRKNRYCRERVKKCGFLSLRAFFLVLGVNFAKK